jgi:hypothetical protein
MYMMRSYINNEIAYIVQVWHLCKKVMLSNDYKLIWNGKPPPE